jgi:hypothetical protein
MYAVFLSVCLCTLNGQRPQCWFKGKGKGVRESAQGCEVEVCSHAVTSNAHDIVAFTRLTFIPYCGSNGRMEQILAINAVGIILRSHGNCHVDKYFATYIRCHNQSHKNIKYNMYNRHPYTFISATDDTKLNQDPQTHFHIHMIHIRIFKLSLALPYYRRRHMSFDISSF